MFLIIVLLLGAMYAAAFYMLQARSTIKLIFGLLLLGHAANLLIFSAGGLVRAKPAIVLKGGMTTVPGHADPIPQALILTAIVISFSVLAFAAVLVKRAYIETGTDDLEQMRMTED